MFRCRGKKEGSMGNRMRSFSSGNGVGQFHRGFYWSSVLRGAGRFAHQYTEPRGDNEPVTQAELKKQYP